MFIWFLLNEFILSVAEVLNQLNQSPNQRALLRNQRGLPSSASNAQTNSNSSATSSALSILNAVAAAAVNGRSPHPSFLAESQISPTSLHDHHIHSQISSTLNTNSFNGLSQSDYNLSSVSSESSTSSLNYHSDAAAYSAAAAAAAAAVYSQLDNPFSSPYSNINYQPSTSNLTHGSSLKLSSKTAGSQRHNPYNRNASTSSSLSQSLSNNSDNESQSASVNAAAAFLSSLGGAAGYPGNSHQMANSYSAAFYYHPYYTHHYLNNHANSASFSANSIVDLNTNAQKN